MRFWFLSLLVVFASQLPLQARTNQSSNNLDVSEVSDVGFSYHSDHRARPRPQAYASSSLTENWLSEQQITMRDDFIDQGCDLNVDRFGKPWIVWLRSPRDVTPRIRGIYWASWEGSGWTAPNKTAVGESSSSLSKPQIVFDTRNTAWVVWQETELNDIWFMNGEGGIWSTPELVHASEELDYYSPKISINGGDMWLTWDVDGPNSMDIFVTRWTGSEWEPPQNITQNRFGEHWFSDLAVDAAGDPHVIWGDSFSNRIQYTRRVDGEWSVPTSLNDPGAVRAAGWPASQIVVDNGGSVHVVWVGQVNVAGIGYTDQEIFYSRLDGGNWSKPVQVNSDNSVHEFYPEVVVTDLNDIWITWYSNYDVSRASLWVTRFDGGEASGEVRLDGGTFGWNGSPRIASDKEGSIWVTWVGIHDGTGDSSILYTRRLASPTPVVLTDLKSHVVENGIGLSWWADPQVFSGFEIDRAVGNSDYSTVGTVSVDTNKETYTWQDLDLAEGTYQYQVTGRQRSGASQRLGPIEVTYRAVPIHFSIQVERHFFKGPALIKAGMPNAGLLSFSVHDVQGRLVAEEQLSLDVGWQTFEWDGTTLSGTKAPSGVYMIRALTFGQRSSSRIVVLR